MTEQSTYTYRVLKKIGSGGSGNIYLAEHLRLGKQVVLKADKRNLNAREDLLRREVDVLKNLKNPYIPQVYDFFQEGDTVYTVMEYIEGESLDRPLKRGETFSQTQVIRWMAQLLNALTYLHAPIHGNPPHGYVHSDIKPANLMRRPNGDICLIDFNIALALGEDRAIGYSPGYASPEHYGLDYSSGSGNNPYNSRTPAGQESAGGSSSENGNGKPSSENTPFPENGRIRTAGKSNAMFTDETVANSLTAGKPDSRRTAKRSSGTPFVRKSATASRRSTGRSSSGTPLRRSRDGRVLPDVRSDIYSTGATFYHLLSGVKPKKNAVEVAPLSRKEYSAPLVELLEIAMDPNPDLRWQTAEEMQDALLHLWDDDPASIRFRRHRLVFPVLFSLLAAAGAFSGYVGLRRMQLTGEILKNVEYARTAQDEGDTEKALEYISLAFPEKTGLFAVSTPPQAQEVLTEILGVYDLSDGIEGAGTIDLPSQPLDMRMASDGSTAVFLCNECFAVADLDTLQVTATLDADPSVLAEVEYIDDRTIACAGEDGLTVYDLTEQKELWQGEAATSIAVSEDGSIIAALYQDEQQAELYDAATGEILQTVDFAGKTPNVSTDSLFIKTADNVFELNEDGSLLAVSFEDGTLSLFRTEKHPEAEKGRIDLLETDSGYEHFEGGFYQKYFAFTATRKDQASSVFVILDTETREQKAGIESEGYYFTDTDSGGILLGQGNILCQVDPETGDTTALVNTAKTIDGYCRSDNYTLITSGGSVNCFDADAVALNELEKDVSCDFIVTSEERAVVASEDAARAWILDYKSFPEADVLSYDAGYSHSIAKLSGDGSRIALAGYNQFRIYDRKGNVICDKELENVYDIRFVRGENQSLLKILYEDGTTQCYDFADGSLLEEETGEAPESSLDQLFSTENYYVDADLRENPVVYESKTGTLIAELEEDAYLSGFYETDQYLVAQYITADAEIYGCLMDQNCQTLAYIPYLCDVMDNTLYLDCPSGQIRAVQIYELDELQTMMREIKKGESKK